MVVKASEQDLRFEKEPPRCHHLGSESLRTQNFPLNHDVYPPSFVNNCRPSHRKIPKPISAAAAVTTTLQTLQHPSNSPVTARTANAHLLFPAAHCSPLAIPNAKFFTSPTASPATLPFRWNIVIQYYDIIAPTPEAAHGLSMVYSGMMQRALQVSIAIPREGPPPDTYNFWVGGVTIE